MSHTGGIMIRLPMRAATIPLVCGAILLAGCSDIPERLTAPRGAQARSTAAAQSDVRAAIAAQERHTGALMRISGVVGTAVGLLPNGKAAVQVFVLDDTPRPIAGFLDSVPVQVVVTGMIVARSDPTQRARPAPLGYSVGHPLITAGSIGARVVNTTGGVFVLSNNHVLANANDANIGDPEYQPGPYDGGTSNDQIATLYAFSPINFTTGSTNTIDAAIALSDVASLGNSSPDPVDGGYGLPNAHIFGDANNDGVFDDRNALLGVSVQKYGRTTYLTQGTITSVNATVDVCYEVFIIFCIKSARFVDQLVITPGTFSGGGDSGSLIVSNDGGNNPVALLFAGSSSETIANRIDR